MRRGRTPALALVLAALALASVTAAASDRTDETSRIHRTERRRGARGVGAHPSTVGEGSAGLVDVPFDTKPIRGLHGGEFPTAVPGGRARFLGGFEVTFASSASSDETPELDLDPLSYGGWSAATGNADGSVAWILTDNYARLMRVELRNEPRSGRLDGVEKIQDATNFWFRPADGDGDPVERTPGTRIDTESIAQIPHDAGRDSDGDSPGGDASSVLNDFVVGVEDARVPGLSPNNLLRFGHGVAGGYRNVPGAAEALGDDACGVNLGPEALVYLPSRYTFAGGLPEGAYPGSVLVAMCEARNASGVITGFVLDAGSFSGGGGLGLIGKVYLRGVGDALAPGRFQCGASDATLTPDGSIVMVLFRCYDFATGDHVASLRTVRADSLRVPGATVHVSPLMDWDGGPIGNVEGVHAFTPGGGGGGGGGDAVGVLMVSDNNLSPTINTQVVEFEVRGPLFDESVVAGGASSSAVLGDLEGGGGDGATMPSPLRHPFRAALWVGMRRRDLRFGAGFIGFVVVSALVAFASIVGRWRSAVASRRDDASEVSPLLPR